MNIKKRRKYHIRVNNDFPFLSLQKKKEKKVLSSCMSWTNYSTNCSSFDTIGVKGIVTTFDKNPVIRNHLIKKESEGSLNNIDYNSLNVILDNGGSYEDTTKKLTKTFNARTLKYYLRADREKSQTALLKGFRNKIIKDFTNSPSKNTIFSSKKNYNNILKYIEGTRNVRIARAKELESNFYKRKKNLSADEMDKREIQRKETQRLKNYKFFKFSQTLAQSKNYANNFFDLNCAEYEPIVRKENPSELYNKNNLERMIKIHNLNTNLYDKDEDILLEYDVQSLKKILLETKKEVSTTVGDTNPQFVKKHLRQKTLRKYRELNGLFFGVPV